MRFGFDNSETIDNPLLIFAFGTEFYSAMKISTWPRYRSFHVAKLVVLRYSHQVKRDLSQVFIAEATLRIKWLLHSVGGQLQKFINFDLKDGNKYKIPQRNVLLSFGCVCSDKALLPDCRYIRHLYSNHFSLGKCRVAEEVMFWEDNVTTGASNDFLQVSRVARQMVERFRFSEWIGQVAIGGPGGNPLLGQQMSSQKDYSMATAGVVLAEIRELVETAYARAKQNITTHIEILHQLAQLLMEKKTVDGE